MDPSWRQPFLESEDLQAIFAEDVLSLKADSQYLKRDMYKKLHLRFAIYPHRKEFPCLSLPTMIRDKTFDVQIEPMVEEARNIFLFNVQTCVSHSDKIV